jgi:hypothetical protein
MKKALWVLLAIILSIPLLLLALSSDTVVTLDAPLRVIGKDTPVQVRVANPHGIQRFTAEIEQNGNRYKVFETTEPAHRFLFMGRNQAPRLVRFSAGSQTAPALRDGKATLLVEAEGNDLRATTGRLEVTLEVNTRPPQVAADGFQHYINQGGAELVTFTVSGYWTEAGVRVGPYTFRSFPMPARPAGERFALFAFPWDTAAGTVPVVFARNPSGAEATARFWFKVFPKRFRTRDLELPDSFLQKVVGELDPNGPGDLVERFLKINGEMRRQNNQALADLRLRTEERVLWSGPFRRYGKTESEFADTRNYVYKGKTIDRQTHLGFDLADVPHVAVEAANDGKVVWADRLGIYGNCVVLDHGYGLQSIYGHLSQIAVQPGEMVKKGQELGRSGSTGLAGGDHLHFSMQVDGVQITPVEWWDEHWIHDRILSKLPGNG